MYTLKQIQNSECYIYKNRDINTPMQFTAMSISVA